MARQSFVVLGVGVFIACCACSSETPQPASGGATGVGGATGGSTAGGSTSGGAGAGGAAGSAGMTAGGSGGSLGGAGGTAGTSGSGGTAGSGGAPVLAGCAQNDYELCIDFESGIDTAVWSGGTESSISTADFAHGAHSYRLYCDENLDLDPPHPCPEMGGGKLTATNLGAITNQIWGRFYVHFAPGAPGGHGNIVAAFDQSNNWYEMGWQFDAMMGVWHASDNAERPLRSKPFIVDQWYCIETFFDGTKTEMPKWWIDGAEAEYYMAANEGLIPEVVTMFDRIEVGFTPYADLGLQMPDGQGPIDDRVLMDMWIDDVAFDTERIGCITP